MNRIVYVAIFLLISKTRVSDNTAVVGKPRATLYRWRAAKTDPTSAVTAPTLRLKNR